MRAPPGPLNNTPSPLADLSSTAAGVETKKSPNGSFSTPFDAAVAAGGFGFGAFGPTGRPDVVAYVKGSPEAVRMLVAPDSVPDDFDAVLSELTREGLRVLALAQGDASAAPLDALMHWTQAETETNISFRMVGLAVMANPLRPDTSDVIGRLQHASIRTLMVTGDHLRTAISVAHKCGILPAQRPILLVDGMDSAGTSTSVASLESHAVAAGLMDDNAGGSADDSAASDAREGNSLPSPNHLAMHASKPASASMLSLSILNVDGSVEANLAASSALPRLLLGELEAAVTGKGFNRLAESMEPSVLLPLLRRAAVWARMSPG